MKFVPFLIFTTAGTLIWNTVLVNLGAQVGESWEDIVGYMDIYSNIAYAVIALLVIVFLVYFIKRKRKE
jgi:membrane protein DedA with SNARE-associated domain